MSYILSDRQKKLLKIIIEEYAHTVTPIASNEIINKFAPKISSATIRNEMVQLEKLKLIEKHHSSSGRVPSIDGYKYYREHILTAKINNDIKIKLKNIFDNRELSIDTVIDQASNIINESFNLPLLITTEENEILKRFDLIRLDEHHALVIIVVSSGNIIKNKITITNQKQFDDITICVRVFNDRLIDTPISQINQKLEYVKEIIRSIVHEYEFCFQKVIKQIFDANIIAKKTKLVGTKYITAHPEFQNIKKLNDVLEFLENVSVFQQIALLQKKDNNNKTLIAFGDEIGSKDIAIASTTIVPINGPKRQISIVGPTRMEFDRIKGVLDFIKLELEKINK